jgi:antitoxin PrlF
MHGVTLLIPVGALYPPVTMHLDYHASIRPRGEVVLTRSTSLEGLEAADPVLGEFLGFLAFDIASHPERLQAVDAGQVDRLQSLVGGIEVDLDAALSADEP